MTNYTCPKCGENYDDLLRPEVCYECGEFGYNFIESPSESNTCDWCGLSYPIGEWDYYSVEVFRIKHTICADCYDKLELI